MVLCVIQRCCKMNSTPLIPIITLNKLLSVMTRSNGNVLVNSSIIYYIILINVFRSKGFITLNMNSNDWSCMSSVT